MHVNRVSFLNFEKQKYEATKQQKSADKNQELEYMSLVMLQLGSNKLQSTSQSASSSTLNTLRVLRVLK